MYDDARSLRQPDHNGIGAGVGGRRCRGLPARRSEGRRCVFLPDLCVGKRCRSLHRDPPRASSAGVGSQPNDRWQWRCGSAVGPETCLRLSHSQSVRSSLLGRSHHVTVTHESSVRRACKPWCSPPWLGDVRHHQADAAAIRAVFNEEGELSAVIELRRRFPGVADNAKARACARSIAGGRRCPVSFAR
jgi:hypothetical protein